MPRYFIELAYDGTNYHGWQVQPNAHTVQAELEKAFSLFFSEELKIIGAGRTDTGVHAEFFTAHFELRKPISNLQHSLFRLNRILPNDIALYKIYPVPDDMHARFSAVKRTYRYQIARKKLPFLFAYSHYVYGPINLQAMQTAAECLRQYHDFTSFSKLHTDTKNNLCEIFSAGFRTEGDLLLFEISANRFLRNMVRSVIGTLLEIGRGKLSAQSIHDIIKAKDRSAAGPSLPGKALFLTNIEYDQAKITPKTA